MTNTLRGLDNHPRGSTRRLDVGAVGEAMLLFHVGFGTDLSVATTASVDIAGAEMNVCATAARFGLRTALCTRVGRDRAGERVTRTVEQLGVSPRLIGVDDNRPTGLLVRELPADGSRHATYYRTGSAASQLDEPDARRLLDAGARVVVVSGLTAALGDGPHACVRALIQQASAARAALVVDANIRPALGRLAQVRRLLLDNLHRFDVFVLGTDEAEILFGTSDAEAVLAHLDEAGVGEAVVTAGAQGAYVLQGGLQHVPSAADVIVDPVGAGDAFTGAYLSARTKGLSRLHSAGVASRVAAGVVASAGDLSGLPSAQQAVAMLAR